MSASQVNVDPQPLISENPNHQSGTSPTTGASSVQSPDPTRQAGSSPINDAKPCDQQYVIRWSKIWLNQGASKEEIRQRFREAKCAAKLIDSYVPDPADGNSPITKPNGQGANAKGSAAQSRKPAPPATSAVQVSLITEAPKEDHWRSVEAADLPNAFDDYTRAMTEGTGIPPQFVRESLKVVVGLTVDQHIAYPNFSSIRMKRYYIQVSNESRTGKNEAYGRAVAHELVKPLVSDISVLDGQDIGSREYLVDLLAMEQEKRAARYVMAAKEVDDLDPADVLKEAGVLSKVEMGKKLKASKQELEQYAAEDRKEAIKILMDKPKSMAIPLLSLHRYDELLQMYRNPNSGLELGYLQAYTRDFMSRGSLRNNYREVKNVKIAFIADATRANFVESFAGKASAGSGFLPRVVLGYGEKKLLNRWSAIDTAKAQAAVRRIMEFIDGHSLRGGVDVFGELVDTPPFCPTMSPSAQAVEDEFLSWLQKQDQRYAAELDVFFRQEILFQVIGTGSDEITPEIVELAARWTVEQLRLRQELWPSDHDEILGRIAQGMRRLAVSEPGITKRELRRRLNINKRNHGSDDDFNRALKAAKDAGWLVENPSGKTMGFWVVDDRKG